MADPCVTYTFGGVTINGDEDTDEIEPFQEAVEPKIISGPQRVRVEKGNKPLVL